MSLRAKLLLAQAPLAVALLVLGFASERTANALGESSQAILRENYRSVLAAQRMKDALEQIDASAVGRLLGGRVDVPREVDAAIERFETELRVQEHNITEPGEREATETLRARWNEVRAEARADLRESGSGAGAGAGAGKAELGPAARAGLYAGLVPRLAATRKAADAILDINQDAMVRKSDAARRAAERYDALLLAATLAALLVGGFASVTLTARALRPLAVLGLAVRRIGEGDLLARARIEGNDEIAAVARELNTMADKLHRYRESSLGELLEAQQSSQAAIDSLPDPVLVLGVAGEVQLVNAAAESLLRGKSLPPAPSAAQPGSSGPGIFSLSLLEPELRAALVRIHRHVISGKGPYTPRGFEEAQRVQGPEGERRLLPRATPVYASQGALSGACILLQDVTRILRFDELKDDIVATVAHEFRTPLTSLRMAIHLCIEGTVGPVTEKQLDLLTAAREDCERLQGIVDDLLDLSRIQAGKVELSLTTISQKTLVDEAIAAQRGAAAQASVVLVGEAGEPVAQVRADPERVALVLFNLVGNALRATPAGGNIQVRATARDKDALFEVSDTGSGIPREYQARIFEKFFRVPGTRGEGIGLGLYLSREIVRAHGGEMGVESEPGKGSRFWFTVPRA